MNFKNKIFIVFFVLLAFILFFNINNVFAFSFTCNNGTSTETIELPDVAEEYAIYFDLPYIISNYSAGIFEIRFLADENSYFYLNKYGVAWFGTVHQFTCKNGSWDYRFNNERISGVSGVNTYCYFNADVYNDVDKTDYFFLKPPQKVEGITIPALETAEQIPEAIAKTMKILIPVGLIVLSIGLVIYLIKRVKYSIM